MKWKKEYEVGVEAIDNQHKKLIEIIASYNEHISDKSTNSLKEMGEIIVYLINYTKFHFEEEEALMTRVSYPDLEEHKQIHRDLINKLKEVLMKMKNKESYTKIEFYYFLMAWVNDHILDTDVKIGKYCNKAHLELKIEKIELLDPNSVLKVILPNLENIETSYSQGQIDKNDRDVRRSIFLQDHYERFILTECKYIINVCLSIILLYNEKHISSDEANILYLHLSLGKIIREFKCSSEEDKSSLIDTNNVLNKIISL